MKEIDVFMRDFIMKVSNRCEGLNYSFLKINSFIKSKYPSGVPELLKMVYMNKALQGLIGIDLFFKRSDRLRGGGSNRPA